MWFRRKANFLRERVSLTKFSFFDSAFWLFSIFAATLFRYEFDVARVPLWPTFVLGGFLGLAGLLVGLSTHLYRGRFPVGSADELKALGTTIFFPVLVVGSLVVAFGNIWGIPRGSVLIAAPIFILLSGGMRLRTRFAQSRRSSSSPSLRRAAVYGAGDAAESLLPQLLTARDAPCFPVVLIDDSPQKANRWIRGVPMGGSWRDLDSIVDRFKVEVIIVAIPSADSELLSRVYAAASRLDLQVVVLPTLRDYLGGRRTAEDLRNVNIEDLLSRQSVNLYPSITSRLVEGKRVLVTGAGGSIGAELSCQLAHCSPASLTLVDRDETGLLGTSMRLDALSIDSSFETYLVDIRDTDAVREMFASRRPEVVFHAAALKHLPILEKFPAEAWKTNVEGTLTVLEAARDVDVAVFVNISTDKAANPVNTLGRSKVLGEALTAWIGIAVNKPYVSVRFGNVLGSRGSLIPVIAEQISTGGPVTITDKAATRYFMSISEACQLVLQAAFQGEAGDVMVLNMGEPVNINAIAEKMIRLSGKSVAIKYTGLRPGEKLHEDLFSEAEVLVPSSHPKIFRVQATPKSPEEVMAQKW